MKLTEEFIEYIENEDYKSIIKSLSNQIVNDEEVQISIKTHILDSEKVSYTRYLIFGKNVEEFKNEIILFYDYFGSNIRREILKNRVSKFFLLDKEYIDKNFNLEDYDTKSFIGNTNLLILNINNTLFLIITFKNISNDIELDENIQHRIKLIQYFFKNYLNSMSITELNSDENYLIDAKTSMFEYLGKISKNLPGFIYQFKLSPNGEYSVPFASDKISDVLGVTKEQVYKNPNLLFDIVHPDDVDRCRYKIEESAKNLVTWKLQYRIIKDGQVMWIDGESKPELKQDGSIIWHGYASSISDIMLLQQKMEDSEAYKNSLLKAINKSVIVSIAGLDGKILEVNDAFVKISQYNREELIGQDHRIVNSGYHPKSLWYGMWSDIKKGVSWRAEVKNSGKYGAEYWVDTVVNPIFDNKNRIIEYLSIRYDITQRKNAEFNLIELNKNLESLVEERTKELSDAVIELDQQNYNLVSV